MFKRRPLPKGIRHEVFIRDSYKCTECGKGKDVTTLEVDHIMAISKGGTDEMSNLRTLCYVCNREKNDLVHENNNPKGFDQFFIKTKKIEDNIIIIKKQKDKPKKCPVCKSEKDESEYLSRIILLRNNFPYDDFKICYNCLEKISKLFQHEESIIKNRFIYFGTIQKLIDTPRIKGIPRSDGYNQGLQFYCGFCKRFHLHGGDGHKIDHCHGISPLGDTGYILERDPSIPKDVSQNQIKQLEKDAKNNWKERISWE